MSIPAEAFNQPVQGSDPFIESFLEASNVSVHTERSELIRIPSSGACVLVANRLFGPVDPILLIKAITQVRTDLVVLTPFDFSTCPELHQWIKPLDMEDDEQELSLLLQVLLRQGFAVVVFPATQGTISRITGNMAIDKRWNPKLVRVLFQLDCPILPVYLRTPSFVNLLHSKAFSFDRLTAFFQDLNAAGKKVTVRFGKQLDDDVLQSFVKSENFGRYLRAKLYALGSPLEVNSFFTKAGYTSGNSRVSAIGPKMDPNLLELELVGLPAENRLISHGQFAVYIASANMIPMVLKEIGRLRELTFRAVGEGTGSAVDLDEYDMYYHQLILWDVENKAIAGGYRVGFGHEIMDLYGKRGFYLHSLFKFQKPFNRILEQSIELGRSYVTPEYQRAKWPLFLLWKGILTVLLQNLGYRYLIGPVSISNEYSSFSKQLMVGFIKRHYWNAELAVHVKARKEFRPLKRDIDMEVLIDKMGSDMRDIDKMIEEVEPKHFKLPVLVKKYLKQEARIIGFNVDPGFSNVLDGLIVLDMMDIPIETLENLNRDLN
jgi:putative hemolysin